MNKEKCKHFLGSFQCGCSHHLLSVVVSSIGGQLIQRALGFGAHSQGSTGNKHSNETNGIVNVQVRQL